MLRQLVHRVFDPLQKCNEIVNVISGLQGDVKIIFKINDLEMCLKNRQIDKSRYFVHGDTTAGKLPP